MKQKLTSLILALVATMGAWATVSFDSAKRYYIVEASTGRHAAIGVTGAEGFVGLQTAGTIGTSFTFSEVNPGVFTITNADNAEQKFGANHTWNTTNTATEWTISEAGDVAGTYLLHSAKGYLNYQTAHSASLYVDGGSATDTDGKKVHFYIMEEYVPSIPSGKFLSIGEKTNSFTASTSASDNDHWYIVTQTRGGETPMYNVGTRSQLKRTSTSITTATLDGDPIELGTAYLVRFISIGDGLYNIQFADGNFIDGSLNATAVQSLAGKYAFYNSNGGSGSYFGWNLNSTSGSIVDNNGAGNGLAFWGSGIVSGTSGNNVWSLYSVSFTSTLSISYNFNTTYGAFFQSLTSNMSASATTYCNLWLSKAEAGKPQLKLITNDATNSGGNNIRSSGGLYAKTSAYQYNLSVSEGKIISYTIVGTAVGALGITPAGAVAEDFAAEASVSKKVTLASPAKSTSFSLTGSGGNQWLDVSQFIIEWETDGEIVTSLGDITNDGIYMMSPHNAERGVLYAGTTYLDACGGHANTNYPANKNVAIDASDANQQFVLYTYGGNTYLYNIGRAKFAGTADGLYYKLTNCPSNKWTVTDGAYSGYFHITSQVDSKMATLNAWVNTGSSDSKDYAITGTTANEEANNFMLNRVGSLTTEQQAAIESIIANYETLMSNLDKLQEYTIGTGVGEYTNVDFPTEVYKETNIATIRTDAADYDASTLLNVKDASVTSISNMVLNSVPANAFYRIKGYATNKYAKAGTITASNVDTGNDPSSKIPNSVDQETDGSDIWYYDAGNHLINYKNGLGTFATRAFASLDKTKETTTFSESTCSAAGAKKIGVYELKSNYSGSKVWYSNTDNVDRNGANDNVNCEWVVTKVTSLPIRMNEVDNKYYGTINLPVAVTIPEGVYAYKAAVAGDVMTLTKVVENGVLAANTPVVLYSASEVTSLAISAEAGTGADDDAFSGTTAAITAPAGTNYVLSNSPTEGVGFYKYTGTVIPGFKAYFNDPSGSSVKGFSFSMEDVETAIRAIESENNGLEIYDIAGRRVPQAQKGLYIVNGKKVMFK